MVEKQNKRLLLSRMMSKFIPGLHAVDFGFQVLNSGICIKKNLDSGACFSKGPETFRVRRHI